MSLLAEASQILTQDPDRHGNFGQALLGRVLALDGGSEAAGFLLTQARLQAGRPTLR